MIPINLIQYRIANLSFGVGTFRRQPSGTTQAAINFCRDLGLIDFSSIKNEDEYLNELGKQTNLLMEKLPSKSWGIARKALNIFLFQTAHDIILSAKYNLTKLIPYLEVPLDNPNALKLKNKAKQEGIILNWKNIKDLKKIDSDAFQKYAKKIAQDEHNCSRCYLDLFYWRADQSN